LGDRTSKLELDGVVMQLKRALMLSFVVFLWGSSFVWLKLGLEEIPPITLAFLRFSIFLPFLLAFTYLRAKHGFCRRIRKDWKTFLILGLTGVTFYHIFQNVGLQLTTASNSSLIISANPLFIALFEQFYLKERTTSKRVLGIALGLLGVVFVIRPVDWSLNPLGVIGDLLSLGAALSWAVYSVLGRKTLSHYGAGKTTALSLIS
jgi:drug/metabolite transporter (DMT)-like permease